MTAGKEAAGLTLLERGGSGVRRLAPDPIVVALDARLARALVETQHPEQALPVAERALEAAEHRDLVPDWPMRWP